MSKKILLKIIFIAMLVFIISGTMITYAEEMDPTSIVDGSGYGAGGTEDLYKVGNIILNIFQVIGGGVAVVATLVLAMRYMYSAPEEKATIKKQMIPFVIGGVLVFGATSLIKIFANFSNELLS